MDLPKWRIVLCDILGRELQVISSIANQKRLAFKLKRPWAFTFQADASDPRVAGLHSDGLPYLRKLRRTVKVFRLEDGVYVPRFTGVVWQTSMVAEDNATVAVSCFDVMKRLDRRRVLDQDGYDGLVHLGAGGIKATDTALVDGIQQAKALIDRTNSMEGPVGISTDTGLGAVFEDAPDRAVRWERQKVAPALIQIADSYNGFDFRFNPVDRDDGILAVAEMRAKIGEYRPEVHLAWDMAPHTSGSVSRMDDGETVANDIWAVGGGESATGRMVANRESLASQSAIGVYVDVSSYSSIIVQSLLDDVAQEELNFRAYGKETVSSKPIPGKGPFPWDDFDLGDVFQVSASERALGGFTGLQRCWGYDVAVSDEDVESCEAVYTSL